LLLHDVQRRQIDNKLDSEEPDLLRWLVEASTGTDADPENIVKAATWVQFRHCSLNQSLWSDYVEVFVSKG
jgi:hypothetical protein